jgi:hypothetical protein
MRDSRVVAFLLCLALLAPGVCLALGPRRAMYVGGTLSGIPDKVEGKSDITNVNALVFIGAKGGTTVVVPWASIQELEYGRRIPERWKASKLKSVFGLLSRGKKHYVTITYKNAVGVDQAAVFEFGDEIVRPTVATLKTKSGKPLVCQGNEASLQMGGACDSVLVLEDEKVAKK